MILINTVHKYPYMVYHHVQYDSLLPLVRSAVKIAIIWNHPVANTVHSEGEGVTIIDMNPLWAPHLL